MKYFVKIITVLIFKTISAQEAVKVNFQDSCIISTRTISKSEFLKSIRRLCPVGIDKVSSFIISYNAGDQLKEFMVNGNWLTTAQQNKKMPSGTKIYCSNIKGSAANGQIIKVPDITITIK